jgi:F0F1-type ATP synthase assembly protein I
MMKNRYIVLLSVVFELVGIVLVCLYFGQKLDERYHLNGLGMVGFSVLGLAGWSFRVVTLSKRMDKISGEADNE